jgi:uncharacterized OB-fold protein
MTSPSPAPARPGPEPDEDSVVFWEGLRAHQVLVQKCANCATVRFPPMPGCPNCGSPAAEQLAVGGAGRIYSWIVAHRPVGSLTEDELPATIVTVELEEGCRMLGRLDASVQPAVDLPVVPHFIDHEGVDHDGWTELAFSSAAQA